MKYTGPIYLGSEQNYGSVVYDTGSGWLTVAGKDCSGCDKGVYDPDSSSTSSKTSS